MFSFFELYAQNLIYIQISILLRTLWSSSLYTLVYDMSKRSTLWDHVPVCTILHVPGGSLPVCMYLVMYLSGELLGVTESEYQ